MMGSLYFLTSVGTSAAISAVLVSIYIVLSRRKALRVIYYPKLLITGGELPHGLNRSWRPWAWIVEAARTKESELVASAGLDAAIYLQLFQTALTIVILSSIVCLPLIIPLALTDDNHDSLRRNPRNDLSNRWLILFTFGNVKWMSNRIWAGLGSMYWVSLMTYWALNRTYKHVVKLRARTQVDAKAMPEQFACLVRDIPRLKKGELPIAARSEQVDNFFRENYPDTYERSLIVPKLKKPSKIWAELERAKSKLARAEAVYDQSKTKELPKGKRPRHRTGQFGLYGHKVDSMNYWNEKIRDLRPVLQEEQTRIKADDEQDAAVIFFNNRRAAAQSTQEKQSPIANWWHVLSAPEPRAVVWENLHVRFYSRLLRRMTVYLVVFLLVLLWMIPVFFVAALATLNKLTSKVSFIKAITDKEVLWLFIQAYLPPLALNGVLYFLPRLQLFLSKQEGIVSKAHLERAATLKTTFFVVINVSIACTLFGSFLEIVNSVKYNNDAGTLDFYMVIGLFGESIPFMASYFMLYIAFRFFVTYGWEMSRLSSLLSYYAYKRFCKTEAELMAAWAPGPIDYVSKIPNDLLVMTITLIYAVIAPLILPFALLYFLIGWFVQRNQALRVYVPTYESGGRFWPHIHNQFLVGLFVAQIAAIGYFGVKRFKYDFFLIPLPFITILFTYITHKVYYPSFRYVPLATARHDFREVPTVHSLVESFTPPCLVSPSPAATESDKIDNSNYEDPESPLLPRTSFRVASPAQQQPAR